MSLIENKIRLLVILPGPSMDLNMTYYEMLSMYFQGDIITSSHRKENVLRKKIFDFGYHCIQHSSTSSLKTNIYFILFSICYCIKCRIMRKTYDLVTTYDPLKTGLIGLICAKLLRIKFVPEINGVYTSSHVYADETKNFISSIKQIVYPRLMGFVLKKADGIKILCESQITPFRDQLDNKKVISRFPCFVDVDAFLSYKQVTKKDNRQILFVGFPFRLKGVDVLIDAFSKISSKYPDWHLKILGYFPLSSELFSYIKNVERVYHHPPVYYSAMPFHISECSLLVLPSRSEAMGRVLVEAMASGKPVIGSDVDGIPNVIENGENGLIFRTGDVDDLAEKLDILMNDSLLREKMGSIGKQRVLQEFTSKTHFSKLKEFYSNVINGSL